ncbi:MAG: hypothetical protein MUC74_09440 [Ideonella sp.]|jgi:hypothetical protein|nr:hypothetical protein [Ideonella sp.]
MSFLYALLLAAVGAMIVAEAAAVVRRLSAPPPWLRTPTSLRPSLVRVETQERRQQALAFVGRDRRAAEAAHRQGDRRRA